MFQTKKRAFVSLAILIIIVGTLCAPMLTGCSKSSDSPKETAGHSGILPDGKDTTTVSPENSAPGDNSAGFAGEDTPSGIPTKDASLEDVTPTLAPTLTGEAPTAAETPTPTFAPTNMPTVNPETAETPTVTTAPTSAPATDPDAAKAPAVTTAPTSAPATDPDTAKAPAVTSAPTNAPTADPGTTKTPTATSAPAKTPTKAPTTTPAPTKALAPTPSASKSGGNGSVSTNGQLQVIGTQLSNADGNPVVLRGISTHGIAWFPDFSTKSFMQTLKEEWGATVFRIAMYSYEGNDSYVNNPSWNKTKVCSLIDAAIELDMYVIVDWHILADSNPQTYQKQASEFFTYIASTYPGVPNILYEICNEPNGGASWSGNIKPYANEIIPVIRQHSPDAVVIVGTPTWSQDVDAAAADPLSFDNVMYALHFYAGTHKEWLRSKADTALAKGLALFVTEWGTTDASGNGAVDKTSSDEWLAYLEKNQISWCNWSLCNKSESSALLLPSAPSTGAMPDSSLSESGKYIKKKMLEYSGTTPVEQKPQDSTNTSTQKATPTPSPTMSDGSTDASDSTNTSGQNPPAFSNSGLTLLYYNENREDSTNTISPRFQIKNNTRNDYSLDKLSILYYYTPEKDIAQCFFCDYAEVNGTSYRAITSDVNAVFDGNNSCMKITFSSGAGILAAGDTATLQVRITNEDWSNYIQSNDASFLPDATTYTENDHAALTSK